MPLGQAFVDGGEGGFRTPPRGGHAACAEKPYRALEDVDMDAATKTRMQIRVVLTVFRSEQARKRRAQSDQATDEVGELLRARSVEMLDDAQAELNGTALTHPELVDELNSARDEVNSLRELQLSAGSRGDRHG